jgi:hypothetical protein
VICRRCAQQAFEGIKHDQGTDQIADEHGPDFHQQLVLMIGVKKPQQLV